MKKITLPLASVTDTSGDGASAVVSVSGGAVVMAIDYFPGTLSSDTGTTITVTDEFNGASFTLLSVANPGTSNVRYNPRALEQLNTDGSDLSTHTKMVVMGALKFAVTGSGAGENGKVIVHLNED
jgi:hypothetical protein